MASSQAVRLRRRGGPRVSVLAYDGMSAFELGIVTEIFGLPRPELDVDWYDLTVCAPSPGTTVPMVGRATLSTRYGLDAFASADTLIVPGVSDVHAPVQPPVVAALRRAHRRGARVVSICSGAFALAENLARFRVDEVSPVRTAARIRVPVLLIHGAADADTPPSHSERVRAALTSRSELLLVPGAGHNQSLSGAEVWTRLQTWVERHHHRSGP